MTIKEKLISMLVSNGMFESQALEVMKIAEPDLYKLVGTYSISLDAPSDTYPREIYSVLYMSIKPVALKWIKENKPMAWFKPMFE